MKKRNPFASRRTEGHSVTRGAPLDAGGAGPRRVRVTLGFKLVALLGLLLTGALAAHTALTARLYTEDSSLLVRQIAATSSRVLAEQLRGRLEGLVRDARAVAEALEGGPEASSAPRLATLFDRSPGLQAVLLVSPEFALQARAFRADLAIAAPEDYAKPLLEKLRENGSTAAREIDLALLPSGEGGLFAAVGFPYRDKVAVIALVEPSRFGAPLGNTDVVTSYLVGRGGRLLAHSERSVQVSDAPLADHPLVAELAKSTASSLERSFSDPASGEARFGVLQPLGIAGAGVVTEIPEAVIQESSVRSSRLAALIGVFVLCAAFLVGVLFSSKLVAPINRLVAACARVSRGDFGSELAVRGSDEIANLSAAFNSMTRGLSERERMYDTFKKFHGEGIAEKLMSGQVRLGGERVRACVLFMDLRGFTRISDRLPPEKVVELLNEYFTRMVRVIQEHGGVVDKYVGDAIMAVWGVPESAPGDAERAMRAAVELRRELARLNADRLARGEEFLRVGIGLHVGDVVVGNVGSEFRMEYTVVGDVVNVAARLEGATKRLGVDLLISRDLRDAAGAGFAYDSVFLVKVAGRSAGIEACQVLGLRSASGETIPVETPYSSWDPEDRRAG